MTTLENFVLLLTSFADTKGHPSLTKINLCRDKFIEKFKCPPHEIENFIQFLVKTPQDKYSSLQITQAKEDFLKLVNEKSQRIPAPISLIKSKAGNMIHDPTKLVFVKSLSHGDVCNGVEIDSQIKPLTMKHCIICSQNAWKYNIKSCIKSGTNTSFASCAINLED